MSRLHGEEDMADATSTETRVIGDKVGLIDLDLEMEDEEFDHDFGLPCGPDSTISLCVEIAGSLASPVSVRARPASDGTTGRVRSGSFIVAPEITAASPQARQMKGKDFIAESYLLVDPQELEPNFEDDSEGNDDGESDNDDWTMSLGRDQNAHDVVKVSSARGDARGDGESRVPRARSLHEVPLDLAARLFSRDAIQSRRSSNAAMHTWLNE